MSMPLNWLMLWESFSFGMKVVTALLHAVGMASFFQAMPISLHMNFRVLGRAAQLIEF